jgi:hypothetical protein
MNALDLIAAAQAKRSNAGLHIHWRLPDGSMWSAYASNESVKAKWIEGKAKAGWVHLLELDNAD